MQLCLEYEQGVGRRFGYVPIVLDHANVPLCIIVALLDKQFTAFILIN